MRIVAGGADVEAPVGQLTGATLTLRLEYGLHRRRRSRKPPEPIPSTLSGGWKSAGMEETKIQKALGTRAPLFRSVSALGREGVDGCTHFRGDYPARRRRNS